MRLLSALVGLVVLGCFVLSASVRAEARVSVVSSSTRLVVAADSGRLLSLIDQASGRDFVAPGVAQRFYEVAIPVADKPAQMVSLLDAETVRTSVRQVGLDTELVITASGHKGLPLVVEMSFRARRDSPLIEARFKLRSEKDLRIDFVRFPVLTVSGVLGDDPADDVVVWPRCDGCVVRNATQNRCHIPTLSYPGSASMQFMACHDRVSGLYLAAQDSEGFHKKLRCRFRDDGGLLSFEHTPEAATYREWQVPYPIVLRTYQGDWQAAADIYRDWAVQQPWCQRTLAERMASGDVPKWLAQPSLFYSFTLRGKREGNEAIVNRLADVVPQAEAWKEVLDGAPVTFMLHSWEKKGPWVAPDYFPPFGGEKAFMDVTRELRERGHRSLVFLSGLKWTLRKALKGQDPIDQTAEFDKRGRAYAIGAGGGKAFVSGKPETGVGEAAQICSGTDLGRTILLDSSLECQRLGISCVQADQIVGGGVTPCFDPTHGHPLGGGNWCAKRLLELFAEIRREGKKRDPDFAFAIEEPGEFFIPVLDTCHTRDYQQGRWPRGGQGIEGVPLFTHVYHEYLHGYGGDSCSIFDRDLPWAVYGVGMNLICGKTPGAAVWTRWFDPRQTGAIQKRILRGHVALWRGPARDFLLFGRRLSTPPLQCDSVELTFHNWRNGSKMVLSVPGVLHSAWRLPDGRVGQVFVCISKQSVTFVACGKTLTLKPGETAFESVDQ